MTGKSEDAVAQDLFDQIQQTVNGYSARPVIRALGNSMALAIGFMCDTPEEADSVIDALPTDLKDILRQEWDRVTAARLRSRGALVSIAALMFAAGLSGCSPSESAAPSRPAFFEKLPCAPRGEFVRAAAGYVVWSGTTEQGVLVEIVGRGSAWGLFVTPEPTVTCHVTSGTRPAPISGTPL